MPGLGTTIAGVAVAAIVAAGCARDAIEPEALVDSTACAACHPDHTREWSGSMHAYASDDPVFVALERVGQRATGGALGDLCIRCHAPAAVALAGARTGDDVAALPRALRGVGCWACHGIDDVAAVHNGGMVLALDGVMRGGIAAPVATPAHGSRRTALLDGGDVRSSDACGSCHDVVSPAGVAVERTYAEWAGSIFGPAGAAPTSCAVCHMVGRDGRAAEVPGAPPRRIHDHGFAAVDVALTPWPEVGAQLDAIARDLRVAVIGRLCVVPAGGGVEIQVTLDNLHGGHAFPSGVTHARRAWVELVAREAATERLVSGRFAPGEVVSAAADPSLWLLTSRFLDARGDEVTHVWDAAAIASDLLPEAVTTDPSDPRYYHAVTRTWFAPGAVDEVDLAGHLEPVGLDLLDALITEGELAPAIRDAMPRHPLPSVTARWRRAEHGWGCVD